VAYNVLFSYQFVAILRASNLVLSRSESFVCFFSDAEKKVAGWWLCALLGWLFSGLFLVRGGVVSWLDFWVLGACPRGCWVAARGCAVRCWCGVAALLCCRC
jgi:hypothetical protein